MPWFAQVPLVHFSTAEVTLEIDGAPGSASWPCESVTVAICSPTLGSAPHQVVLPTQFALTR